MASILSVPGTDTRKASGNACLKIEGKTGSSATFVCQFNPDNFHIHTQGKFSTVERQGKDKPIVQFMGGSVSVLDLKLYFDTSTSYEITTGLIRKPSKAKASDVSDYANVLLSVVRIDGKEHRPPVVTFYWGSFSFKGFAQTVDVTYTMFETGGMPVRCEVDMRLIAEEEDDDGSILSPLESPDRTKCIVLKEGMNLWDIAGQEYGDAGYWREIARANNIMDPLAIPVGTNLRVPALV